MLKRKTSRVKRRKDSRQLHLRVSSPRIFGFACMRLGGRVLRFVLLLALLVGAGWGAKTGLRKVFIENEEFILQEIELETNGCLVVEDVVRVAEIDPSASVFAVTLSSIRKSLEARPGVLRAKVSRRLPGTLKLEVEERIPVAWLECRNQQIVARDAERGLLVDEEGVVFPCEPWWREAAQKLPVVIVVDARLGDFETGERLRHREAERALHLVCLGRRMLSGADWRLSAVGVENDYSLMAATTDGTMVTFGMYDHQRQLADLLALRRHAAAEDRTMERVNLIPERNIPVVYMPLEGTIRVRKADPAAENRLEQDIRALLNRG